jgi:hypothetical protein
MQHEQHDYDDDDLAGIWRSAQHRRTADIYFWVIHFFETRRQLKSNGGRPKYPQGHATHPETARRRFRLWHFSNTEVPMIMKHRAITGFVAVALLAATTTAATMRSHSTSVVRAADMVSLPDTAAGVNKLPVEEFEDMSLVYSTATKR